MVEFRERETKFDVSADWALPDLSNVVPEGGRVETVTHSLTSAYFDTASRDLLSAGATLRRRTGDTDNGWHLKVPDGNARIEVRAEIDGRGVPQSLRDLIVGVRSGEALRSMVTMNTTRCAHSIIGADGTVLAEIDDDRVSAVVSGPRRRTVSWREVEVELVDGDEVMLTNAGNALLAAGATRATATSKVARALSRPGHDPESDVSLGGLIRRYMTTQVDVLLRCDLELRRGRDVTHETRVALRRLRSVLHVFSDVFEPQRSLAFDTELQWYAGVLGEVRDREVLAEHLAGAVAALPQDVVVGPVAERIAGMLNAESETAKAALAKAMKSPRYFALVRELKAWRDDPAFLDGQDSGVGPRVRAAAAKMHNRARAATRIDNDDAGSAEAVHRARKAAKRARYTAELAMPKLGKKAKAFIADATTLQDRLGGHQDNMIAERFLLRAQRAAEAAAGESPFTFGVLWAVEHRQAIDNVRSARAAAGTSR